MGTILLLIIQTYKAGLERVIEGKPHAYIPRKFPRGVIIQRQPNIRVKPVAMCWLVGHLWHAPRVLKCSVELLPSLTPGVLGAEVLDKCPAVPHFESHSPSATPRRRFLPDRGCCADGGHKQGNQDIQAEILLESVTSWYDHELRCALS